MKRRPASHPACAVFAASRPQLIHDRGPPLVFVAGEQGHGGAVHVFVDNLGAICDNVTEWTEKFGPRGLALRKNRKTLGLRGGPRDRAGRTRTLLTGDFKAFLDGAARVNGTLASRTM